MIKIDKSAVGDSKRTQRTGLVKMSTGIYSNNHSNIGTTAD
jgi:hypothetical protein